MMFSVIIPVYNTEKYLDKCVNSVLNQTLNDFEIIIVDDGSGENCAKIVDSYKKRDSRINVIHQKNKGLGGARNTGIQHAKGEYLFFLDSDDYINITSLEIAEEYINKYNLDILAYDLNLVNENGDLINTASYSKYKELFNQLTINEILLFQPTACGKIYRRSLYVNNKILFPEKLWYEDLATVYKLYIYVKNVGYLKASLYNYVQQPNSITHSKDLNRMMEIIPAVDSIISFYKQNGVFNFYENELEWISFLHLLYYSSFRIFECGYRKKCIHKLKKYLINIFPNYKQNQLILNNIKEFYLMEHIYNDDYFIFYLKNNLIPKMYKLLIKGD